MEGPLWLDAVAAVPLVGLRMRLNYGAAVSFAQTLAPYLQKMNDSGTRFTVNLNAAAVRVDFPDGGSIQVDPNNLVFQDGPGASTERSVGEFPRFMMSPTKKFTDALADMRIHTDAVIKCLEDSKTSQFDRIGIAATAVLKSDKLPPGILAFRQRVEEGWKPHTVKLQSAITVRFEETPVFAKQCHHMIQLDAEKSDELHDVVVVLDWQEVLAQPIPRGRVVDALKRVEQEAMTYFQRFAEEGPQ